MKYGLQLYTIRDEITDKESFKAALKKVKEIGYDGVEFAGYHDMTAEEMKEELDKNGLVALSAHEHIRRFESDIDNILPYLHAIGAKQLGMSGSPCNSPEEIERTKRVLAEAKVKAEEFGIEIMYHNHDHEFKNIEGLIPINEIKKVSGLEMDTFWSYYAGENPAEHLEENKQYLSAVHIKDGIKETRTPCTIGEGDNDIKGIVKMAEKLGFDWVIVENDNPTPTGFEDVTRSMNWLKANI